MAAPTTKLCIALGLLLLSAAACKKGGDTKPADVNLDDPAALAEDGADSAVAEVDAEVVTSSLLSATTSGGSLTLASTGDLGLSGIGIATVGDGAKALYNPRNCLTVTSDEPAKTVTYDFVGCAGHNGIVRITGTVKATYATSPNKLTLNLVGTNLHVNRAIIDWSATAEITSAGLAREMRWKGQLAGVTGKGREFSRTNEKVVTWQFGGSCFGVAGVSEGNVRGRYLRTEIADFRRCQGGCPEAGGRISISNEAKLKVEITFDGTRRATATSPRGTTSIDLACAP